MSPLDAVLFYCSCKSNYKCIKKIFKPLKVFNIIKLKIVFINSFHGTIRPYKTRVSNNAV